MIDWDDYPPDGEPPEEAQRRDPKTDEAKEAIKKVVKSAGPTVFYSRQLEVRLEREFFHWVTNRAVRELIDEGFFSVREVKLAASARVRFLIPRGVRYHARLIKKSGDIVKQYSAPTFTSACGEQADMLFLNAFAVNGFRCLGQDVNEFRGKKWMKSNHDLDLIIERDEIVYGVEVKNTLDYISRDELRTKVAMCDFLEVVPLMVLRAAPKSYIWTEVARAGWGAEHRGFVLLYGTLIYPFGWEQFAGEVRTVLGLPAQCPRGIEQGHINRFLGWHRKRWGV